MQSIEHARTSTPLFCPYIDLNILGCMRSIPAQLFFREYSSLKVFYVSLTGFGQTASPDFSH